MGHDYTTVTKSDNTFTPVSDITPIGTVEEKLTWAYIVPNYDTWLELLAKEHWADWLFGTAWVDAWDSLTTPSKTFSGISKSDNAYNPITTPSASYNSVTK